MAVEVGGEKRRTRLPCLATLRYMVAAVVAVLTMAVAVKMITVDLRPQDIQLSILQGHIRASPDLWERNEKEIYSVGRPSIVGLGCGGLYDDSSYYQRRGRLAGSSRSMKRPRFIGGDPEEDEGCDQGSLPVTIVTYGAAKYVSLRVTLRAYNPSGRADVNCTGIALRILDHSNDTTAAMEIATLELKKGFLLGPYSSHTVRRWALVDDPVVLSYIARTYPGKSSFKAMVQVNTTVTSAVTPVRLKTTPKTVTSRCSVTVGLDEPSVATGAVDCRPPRDVDSVGSVMPALAPSPAPAPAVPADIDD